MKDIIKSIIRGKPTKNSNHPEEELGSKCEQLKDNLFYSEEIAGIGSWVYYPVTTETFFTDGVGSMLGCNIGYLNKKLKSFLFYVHPDDQDYVFEKTKDLLEGKEYDIKYKMITAHGAVKVIHEKTKIIYDQNNEISKIIGVIQDVTQQIEEKENEHKAVHKVERLTDITVKNLLEETKEIQRQWEIIIENSNAGIEIINSDGVIKYASQSIFAITGYSPEELIGESAYKFLTESESYKIKNMIGLILNNPGKNMRQDIIFKTKTGREIYLEVYINNLLHEPSIEGFLVRIINITSRIDKEKRIAHISTHDQLTDLPNRIYFAEHLNLLYEEAENKKIKFAVMMIEFAGLTDTNYSLGYDLGTQLIVAVVKRMEEILGKDDYISRHSDNSFALIIPALNSYEECENIAKAIIKAFLQPFNIKIHKIKMTVNIGISMYPKNKYDTVSLNKQAKIALIKAKKEGKNTYKVYDPELNIQNYKNVVLRDDIYNAIEKEQFKIYYQPIVNLKTNEIIAAEALIRWDHPEWGIIPSLELISIAEEAGLIIYIRDWVLRKVCEDYKQWVSNGLMPIKIGISVTSIQFMEKENMINIKNTLSELDLDPNFLIIEIKESVLSQNPVKTMKNIKKIKSFGIQVAIDNFGAGFSSLMHLNSLDIDILKLDRSFIENLPLDEVSKVIIESTVKLAKKLKIKLVAVGIDNGEQLSYLNQLNCYAGQGTIYSEPLPLEGFVKLLAKKKCLPTMYYKDSGMPSKDRRKLFRVNFSQFLEADLTILKIKGKKINVGNTKVLIQNIGPGGLLFISNINLPTEKDIVLQFITQLRGKEIKLSGYPLRVREIENTLYEYGVEFIIDENDRGDLVGTLNKVQVDMKKNILFAEGSFISGSYNRYFIE